MQTKIDPIFRSVLANRFDAVCSEMGETMMLTSRSPIFSEARRFCHRDIRRQRKDDRPKTIYSSPGGGASL